MDWQEHFGNLFFKAWENAGLPDPKAYHEPYINSRLGAVFVNRFNEKPFESTPLLEEHLLNSIYGFGALHGTMFSRLLNLNDNLRHDVADWCGRFNLGISTFDYLADETTGGIESVIALDAFNPFTKKEIRINKTLSSAQTFLNNLAKSVVSDLMQIEKENRNENRMMTLMQSLFEAQVFLSKQTLSNTKDLDNIAQALFLKSAEPFRLMAEFALCSSHKNSKNLSQAKAIGTAIGSCYWLIDDAKDVWMDLKAGEWNIFLHHAAQNNAAIFNSEHKEVCHADLKTIWKAEKTAEHLINITIKDLLAATKNLEVPESIIKHELGVLGSSLWHWCEY